MANVYLVETEDLLRKRYWMKVWKKSNLAWKKEQVRLSVELLALRELSCPYFIRPHLVAQLADGRHYMLVEFAQGQVLEKAVEGPKEPAYEVTIARAVRIALQLLHAVRVVDEENGVIHGGLCPKSIYLRKTGDILILGLEYARVTRADATEIDESSDLRHHRPLDVLRYAAPEVLDDPTFADSMSEQFSISAILYYCVTGKHPFPGDNHRQLRMAIDNFTPMAPRKVRPDAAIPPMLEDIIMRSLAKARTDRFESIADLRDALQTVEWELMARKQPSSAATHGMDDIDADERRVYYAIARRLIDEKRRAASRVSVPMRNLDALMREEQPHFRHLKKEIGRLFDAGSAELTDEEKAQLAVLDPKKEL